MSRARRPYVGCRVVILEVDRSILRAAGYAPAATPPRSIVGRLGTVTRMMCQWDGMWVGFGRPIRRRPHWWEDASDLERESRRRAGHDLWEVRYPKSYVFALHEVRVVRGARAR